MQDLHLTVEGRGDGVFAAYRCPCGCTPGVAYERGMASAYEGCCCGNEFAVGPQADERVHVGPGFERVRAQASTPWGERLPIVWAIGPSTHAEATDGDHDHDHGAHHHADASTASDMDHETQTVDPVCGMNVTWETARAKGLISTRDGRTYGFCGKGCKLEFDEDPERYLDPAYIPSM